MTSLSPTTLTPNISNRVRKLPKPSNNTQGLQPLFEAISNAFYAVEDLYGDSISASGQVVIHVNDLNDVDKLNITVSDNGIGLDKDRYDAFCELDTAFKRQKGGKGVGRLFWLDAFKNITVKSYFKNVYLNVECRKFEFALRNKDQIQPIEIDDLESARINLGTDIEFTGLRGVEYQKHFPKRIDSFLRYFSAHFIADFLVGSCPKVTVNIDGKTHIFPQAVSSLVVGGTMATTKLLSEEYGELIITCFACKKEASTGLEGSHQLHLLADGRTVETRKIDGLLGIQTFSHKTQDDLIFHGCVAGGFLNDRINEGRTAFTFPESVMKRLIRECVEHLKEAVLKDKLEGYIKERENMYDSFVDRYPIYGFDDRKTQLDRIPFNASKPEEFAAGLVKYQIRRDEDRQNDMQNVIELLENEDDVPKNFLETVVNASRELQETEKLSLAQHVVRRKLVLDILDKLILRIRDRGDKEDDFHLEETLHSFICPMRIKGDDPNKIESTQHDLWLVDERLAFTRSFSSDQRLDKVLKDRDSPLRPDLMVWNLAHGLGVSDPRDIDEDLDVSAPLKKVMIVEFKRPGREKYPKIEDQLENQITKYLRKLKDGEIETYNRQKVRIAEDCLFFCYIIADIEGDLKDQLAGWSTTANGEGRVRSLDNDFKGSTIEVIQWNDLVNDAWMRNEATLNAAGLRRSKRLK